MGDIQASLFIRRFGTEAERTRDGSGAETQIPESTGTDGS